MNPATKKNIQYDRNGKENQIARAANGKEKARRIYRNGNGNGNGNVTVNRYGLNGQHSGNAVGNRHGNMISSGPERSRSIDKINKSTDKTVKTKRTRIKSGSRFAAYQGFMNRQRKLVFIVCTVLVVTFVFIYVCIVFLETHDLNTVVSDISAKLSPGLVPYCVHSSLWVSLSQHPKVVVDLALSRPTSIESAEIEAEAEAEGEAEGEREEEGEEEGEGEGGGGMDLFDRSVNSVRRDKSRPFSVAILSVIDSDHKIPTKATRTITTATTTKELEKLHEKNIELHEEYANQWGYDHIIWNTKEQMEYQNFVNSLLTKQLEQQEQEQQQQPKQQQLQRKRNLQQRQERDLSTAATSVEPAFTWGKIVAMKQLLEENHYDYIVYLDINSVIIQPTLQLNGFFTFFEKEKKEKEEKEIDILLSEDQDGINTSVMIVKNTNWSKWFFSEIWRLAPELIVNCEHCIFDNEDRAFHHAIQSKAWQLGSSSRWISTSSSGMSTFLSRAGGRGSKGGKKAGSSSSSLLSSGPTLEDLPLFYPEYDLFEEKKITPTRTRRTQATTKSSRRPTATELQTHFLVLPQCALNAIDIAYREGDFIVSFLTQPTRKKESLLAFYTAVSERYLTKVSKPLIENLVSKPSSFAIPSSSSSSSSSSTFSSSSSTITTILSPQVPLLPTVYQTWKTNDLNLLEDRKKARYYSWLRNGFDVVLKNDEDCLKDIDKLMEVSKEKYPFRLAYERLSPVQKADFWRYVVIYLNGGIYSDIDIGAVPETSLLFLNLSPRIQRQEIDLVGIIENDLYNNGVGKTYFQLGMSPMYARVPQLRQSFFYARKGHPRLLSLLVDITEMINYYYDSNGESFTPFAGTVSATYMNNKHPIILHSNNDQNHHNNEEKEKDEKKTKTNPQFDLFHQISQEKTKISNEQQNQQESHHQLSYRTHSSDTFASLRMNNAKACSNRNQYTAQDRYLFYPYLQTKDNNENNKNSDDSSTNDKDTKDREKEKQEGKEKEKVLNALLPKSSKKLDYTKAKLQDMVASGLFTLELTGPGIWTDHLLPSCYQVQELEKDIYKNEIFQNIIYPDSEKSEKKEEEEDWEGYIASHWSESLVEDPSRSIILGSQEGYRVMKYSSMGSWKTSSHKADNSMIFNIILYHGSLLLALVLLFHFGCRRRQQQQLQKHLQQQQIQPHSKKETTIPISKKNKEETFSV